MSNNTILQQYNISEEQLDKTHRVIDENAGTVFYRVESQTEPGTTYTVRYLKDKGGLSCTCKGAQEGYICWHKRAAVCHNRLYKLDERRERLMAMGLTAEEATEALSHDLTVDGKPANDETLVRVYGPRQRRPSEAEIEAMAEAYQPRPFSLMR
jgi:hypothetical protein